MSSSDGTKSSTPNVAEGRADAIKRLTEFAAKPLPSSLAPIEGVEARLPAAEAALPKLSDGAWIWAGVAALFLLAALVGAWWWWRSRRSARVELPSAPGLDAPDPHADFKQFCSRLPRPMRRVLDDFQPVVVLGNNASEKDRVIAELSGVAENERVYAGRASFKGEGLDVYLGARCLVLAPTERFLNTPASVSQPGWVKVARRICLTHSPRAVICLSQSAIDNWPFEELTNWASTLRSHIDLLVGLRGESVEVTIAVAQAVRGPAQDRSSLTDAWFDLLVSLMAEESAVEALNTPLGEFVAEPSLDSEERRQIGARWIADRFGACRRMWPRLLARSPQTALDVLRHIELFERFDRLTTALGIALVELLGRRSAQHKWPCGVELGFLPSRNGVLCGSLKAFSVADDTQSWYPSSTMFHRLAVATGTAALMVAMWFYYDGAKQEWYRVATTAKEYAPLKHPMGLNRVRDYVFQYDSAESERSSAVASWVTQFGAWLRGRITQIYLALDFYDRDLSRCVVVESARAFLQTQLVKANAQQAPEHILYWAALYLAGDPSDCDNVDEHAVTGHRELMQTIRRNTANWQAATGMLEEEIDDYLTMACPLREVPPSVLNALAAYSPTERDEKAWEQLPDAAQFVRALGDLSGQCALEPSEERAIADARAKLRGLEQIDKTYGAAGDVLRIAESLRTPSMDMLKARTERYQPRLRVLDDLSRERERIELLASDVRAFSLDSHVSAPAQEGLMADFVGQLEAALKGELPSPEKSEVRLTLSGNTYLIDRAKARASLQSKLLGELGKGFNRGATARRVEFKKPEATLFSREEFGREHPWFPGSAIPVGVEFNNAIPWRYTLEGFQMGALNRLERVSELVTSRTCETAGTSVKPSAALLSFGEELLSDYLKEYLSAWQGVYDSFSVSARDEAGVGRILTTLAGGSSPQLAILREIARQTTLPVTEGSPYAASIGAKNDAFASLALAADPKAFRNYQALLLELANSAQDTEGPGQEKASSSQSKAEETVDSFIKGLTGFARVVAQGLSDPKQDLRGRVNAWIDQVGMDRRFQGLFLKPFDAAYAVGMAGFERRVTDYWKDRSKALGDAVTDRYPFNRNDETDAAVDDVIAWATPETGRFFTEIAPIYELLNRARRGERSGVLAEMANTVRRMRAISRLLFSNKGEPAVLSVYWKPVPVAGSRAKWTTLRAGTTRVQFFNTKPQVTRLALKWNEVYDACIEAELADPSDGQYSTGSICERSAWAFFHLLNRATKRPCDDGGYGWELDVSEGAAHRGTLSAHYQVYDDAAHCDALFSEALQWK
jgi:hypothetical protein